MTIGDNDGCAAITIRQGYPGAIIFFVCVVPLLARQLKAARDSLEAMILMLFLIVASYGFLCAAFAYEVISVTKGRMYIDIRLCNRWRVVRRIFLIHDIKSLCLEQSKGRASVHWKVFFDCSGKRRRLETYLLSEDEGQHFLNTILKPLLEAQGYNA
jgi:hypothetical protein